LKQIINIIFLSISLISADVVAETGKSSHEKASDENAVQGEILLQKFLDDTDTMQAAFHQVLRTHDGEVLQESNGTFYLDRPGDSPGRFRWDYQAPHEQVIVSDGERIWMYDVELRQVTVQKQSTSLPQTPMALLQKSFRLRDNYDIAQLDERDGIYRLKLSNKHSDSDFGEIVIGVSAEGLRFLQLHDQFEQVTDIVFSDVTTNLVLENSVFQFVPPEGADVFGG
jgi:outer membrane lipoprotein carrier protein